MSPIANKPLGVPPDSGEAIADRAPAAVTVSMDDPVLFATVTAPNEQVAAGVLVRQASQVKPPRLILSRHRGFSTRKSALIPSAFDYIAWDQRSGSMHW
jgi:hypothetical protein